MAPRTFMLDFKCLSMPPKTLLDLAPVGSSSSLFVTHPSFWTPRLSQQFLNTRD